MDNLWLITALLIGQVFVHGFSQMVLAAGAINALTPEPEVPQLLAHRLVVAVDENVTLPCFLDGHDASNCYWMIDEDPIEVGGHYQLTGNRSRGDCTLRISHFRLTDIGLWHCGLPRTDSRAAVKTGYVELAKDPQSGLSGVFWLHHLRRQEVVSGDSVVLKCEPSVNASMCYWTHDGRVEVMRKRLTSSDKSSVLHPTSPTDQLLDDDEDEDEDRWNGGGKESGEEDLGVDCSLVLVTVNVEHQGFWQCVYEEASDETLLKMTPLQLHVSARVNRLQVWSDNDDRQHQHPVHQVRNGGIDIGSQSGQRLPVNPRGATTLRCSAEGSPTPHFRWDQWRQGQWHTLHHRQNITLPVNATGNYSCLAWNTPRGGNTNATLRSTYILIGMTDIGEAEVEVEVVDGSGDSRGGYSTVIAVSGALVLIALVLVVGLLCQRKRGGFALDMHRTL